MSILTGLTRKLTAAAVGLLLGLSGCIGFPSEPPPPPPTTTLAVCPTDQTKSTSGLIGLLGGVLTLDGTSIRLSLASLLSPTTIALTIPASQYMEISATADGGSILFNRPVTITIDYSRCSSEIQQKTLSVWHIDENTKALLENMGGDDNKSTHRITFTTDHLSGYALAF